jgi:hypothetical protein
VGGIGSFSGCHRKPASSGPDAASASPSASSSVDVLAAGDLHIGGGSLSGANQRTPLVVPTGTAPPMPSGASDADRAKELIGLLSGRVGPDALPVVPTDPGATFDEGLRENLLSPTRVDANVTIGPIGVTGALAKTIGTERVIAGARGRMRSCYRMALNGDPEIAGHVRARVDVGANGEVKKAELTPAGADGKNVVGNEALNSCVTRILRNASFPDSDAGTSVVTFDVTFASSR